MPQHDRDDHVAGEFAQQLVKLARQLQYEESPQEVMDRVAAAAAVLVLGMQEATIRRVRRRREAFTAAATSDCA